MISRKILSPPREGDSITPEELIVIPSSAIQ
jgi:hypothetical protein